MFLIICQNCGNSKQSQYMDVHHIIPVRDGGDNSVGNMITLCRKCHNRIERNIIPCPEIEMNFISEGA